MCLRSLSTRVAVRTTRATSRTQLEASHRDGTLLLLDPKGKTLTRIWFLLDVWETNIAARADQLRTLSLEINGEVLKQVRMALGVAEAEATMENDRQQILGEFGSSAVGIKELNRIIKSALMDSAAAEGKRADHASMVCRPYKARRHKPTVDRARHHASVLHSPV